MTTDDLESLDILSIHPVEELRLLGADHPSIPLLMTATGVGWVLAYTIASEIGDIDRFASPKKLARYRRDESVVIRTDQVGFLHHMGTA